MRTGLLLGITLTDEQMVTVMEQGCSIQRDDTSAISATAGGDILGGTSLVSTCCLQVNASQQGEVIG